MAKLKAHPRSFVEVGIESLGEVMIIFAALLLQIVTFSFFEDLPKWLNVLLIIILIFIGVTLCRHATRLSIMWDKWCKKRKAISAKINVFKQKNSVNLMDKSTTSSDTDVFQHIGTPLAALSLFYAVLLQIVADNFDAPPFWRYSLIFLLLLITFFFSLAIYGQTQKKNEILKTAGLFVFALWFFMLLFLQNTINEGYATILPAFTKLGMGWLIILPAFLIPIVSIIWTIRTYKRKALAGRKFYYILFAILISGATYLLAVKYKILFKWLGSLIGYIDIAWIQVILAGVLIGSATALIVAPTIPILNDIIYSFFNFINRKIEEIKKV